MNVQVNTRMNVVLPPLYSLAHSSYMTIADDLDKAMKNYDDGAGILQPELAKISGVPQPTISRTLKGISTPETKTLIKLARALKCTLGGYTGAESAPAYHEPTASYSFPSPDDESTLLRAFRLAPPEVRLVWLGMARDLLGRLNNPSQLTGNGKPSPE